MVFGKPSILLYSTPGALRAFGRFHRHITKTKGWAWGARSIIIANLVIVIRQNPPRVEFSLPAPKIPFNFGRYTFRLVSGYHMKTILPVHRFAFYMAFILTAGMLSSACSSTRDGVFNLYSVDRDIRLGKDLKRQIEKDPAQYPVLPEAGNEKVYAFVRGVAGKILDSGKVKHRDEFTWEVHIIQDDETLNAFCTPGGFIYVYTGLIHFLDNEDQLAGVLGHEIAHADLRHSTRQMTSREGASFLSAMITPKAEPGFFEDVALGLLSLKFSRAHENEADLKSVEYLCGSGYKADAAAGFFRKMEDSPRLPAFISTHPSPANRVKRIEELGAAMDCPAPDAGTGEYLRIKRLLRRTNVQGD